MIEMNKDELELELEMNKDEHTCTGLWCPSGIFHEKKIE